ncbi:VOC family protein [Plantactinospora endophytica]|uniref:Glyoxalase n=1 Tax=Plantactinospora endophytica TaxID=673535 RepID=A0ABQ4E977_9ACTN|nr:VOC family protein [Plantactinospora endophytica]GIG91275.1 glyoxalase [Plantactinospora endophytica]
MKATMNAIDVIVSDLDASVAFYRLLGLEFQVDERMPEHASCEFPGGLHLMLDTEKSTVTARPGWSRAAGSPPAFFAFEFGSPAEVDAAYAELTGAGHRGSREPWDAYWGMRYATVLDPDGNGIDLYAALPAN